jgi:hypothetical protein
MEYTILSVLEFNLTSPSSYRFLERFFKVSNSDNMALFNLSRYLIELPLIEYRMLKYTPSNIASSALFLANKILIPQSQSWTETLISNTGFTESSLKPCAKDLCILL